MDQIKDQIVNLENVSTFIGVFVLFFVNDSKKKGLLWLWKLIYTLMQIIGILFRRAYEKHLQTDGDKQMAGCSHLVEIYFNLYAY